MRYKLSLLAVLLGGFLVMLAASLTWGGHGGTASAANPTPTVIATVTVGDWPYGGVAVNSATNRIYVTNWASASVSVVDGETNAVMTTIPVGAGPVDLALNSVTNRIYVVNDGSDDVSVIDAVANTEIDTDEIPENGMTRIALPGYNYEIALNANTNLVYVSTNSTDVLVIDGDTNTVTATIPVGESPWGVGVNPNTNRIYVTHVMSGTAVIDGANNTVLGEIPSDSIPWGVGVNPNTNRIYIGNYGWGGGMTEMQTISMIDGETNDKMANIPAYRYPVRVAVNAVTNRVYALCDDFMNHYSSLSVVDGNTNGFVANIDFPNDGVGDVAVNSASNRVYAFAAGVLWVIQDYPMSVGGIAQLPASSDSSALNRIALAGLVAVALVSLTAGAWYARRRWLRRRA